MKPLRTLALLAFLIPWGEGIAQDLVITNARIIDGTGRSIERGGLVITEGRITSVFEGAGDAHDAVEIDAQGMTVMPGLIDTHRHDLLGFSLLESEADVAAAIERETPAKLQALLAEGFTTVMMPGVFLSAGLDARRLLEAGEFEGPRLLFSGPGFTAPDDFPVRGMVCGDNAFCADRVAFQVTDPDTARAHVRALAEAGVDGVKVFVDNEGADLDDAVLAAIAEEARSLGLPAMLHAHRVEDMLAGVRLGANRLVHTPGDASIADGPGARLLREEDVAIATTVSFSSPQFAQAAGFDHAGAARHSLILQNIRHLFDEGVVVAFGTDSPDLIRPMVEIEQLSTVLEPEEIIAALTRNAAAFLDLSDEIGTLEPGKVADIVIIGGDPLADVHDLAHVEIVIRDGRVVVDNR